MSFQPTPKQALVLWNLLITGEQPAMSTVKPELNSDEREELVGAGFIKLVKRKQLREEGLIDLKGSAKHIVLTPEARKWALGNFNVEFSKSPSAAPVLQKLLIKLNAFLQAHESSFENFLPSQKNLAVNLNTVPVTSVDLEEEIREAYSRASNGQTDVRVRLSELRQYLGDLPREEIDRTLREMQLEEKLVLMHMDDPQEIKPEDEQAAVDVSGHKRHIVYWKA